MGTVDDRWVKIRACPVIITGGELNLQMLDLKYNPGVEITTRHLCT